MAVSHYFETLMTSDTIDFILVPIGMAVAGWVYRLFVRHMTRISKLEARCEDVKQKLDARCDDLKQKLVEDYVKKVEMQQMLLDVKTALNESINHLRDDLRTLLTIRGNAVLPQQPEDH